MQKYIKEVVEKIVNSNNNFTNTTIILPSKRASVFVKKEIKIQIKTSQFLPVIVSIEDFISNVSKIESADSLVLLFEFYKIYIQNTDKDEIEKFEDFSNWATILIKDFNEIDSYLIDQNNIFSYLKDINRIDNWFKNNQNKTKLTKSYIRFFEDIEIYYTKFYQTLKKQNIGYQGLQYREAYNNIDKFIKDNQENKFIFIGFNALNTSEENIIQLLLENGLATVYFDLDKTILEEGLSANRFIKSYKNNWKYFKNRPFNSITNEFQTDKNISIIGIPKNVSQIKYASEIIKNSIKEEDNIAFVLANENLLTTTINSLPSNIDSINITMGLPLKNIVYADFFYLLFKLHLNNKKIGNNKSFYFKDVIAVLNHPTLKNKLETIPIINKIKKNNLIFIEEEKIKALSNLLQNKELINYIFSNWSNSINQCIQIINVLKIDNVNNFDMEYLNRFEQIFNQIEELNNDYGYIESLESLTNIFNQIINNETLSFKGDAIRGLQIMGMLETRVLEFDTVIITSVNEGFLPSGKSNNSFIPFDIKLEKGIPTYQEKDSIFSYHFFRLIARAKKVYLLYNTETDEFGSGEQSRFITQLELLQDKYPNIKIKKSIISPKINNEKELLKKVIKNDEILGSLYKANVKGFSPTSLTNYIYNPIAFYKRKILKIYPLDEIEETIAFNTLGTVVHKVLEQFYIPFKNKFVKKEDVIEMKKNVAKEVSLFFKKEYKNGDISKGKNLLIFEVSKQFVTNFLNKEIELLKQNKQLKIIDLEVDLSANIEVEGIDFPIRLIGQADRIDKLDGVLRIIDYKTGKVEQSSLNLVSKNKNDWDLITKEYKYSKAFQVLLYGYMYAKTNNISFENQEIESGIISFKNLKAGFMKINKSSITNKDMQTFEIELKKLLSEIFNKDIPFIENENLPF